MCRFFNVVPKVSSYYQSSSTVRSVLFDVVGNRTVQGELIKITADKTTCSESLHKLFAMMTRQNPNHLFIMTVPSRMLHGAYGEFPFPGHNSVFITNTQGEIASFLSKRGDFKRVVAVRKRIPDTRFQDGYPSDLKIVGVRFTSLEEEKEFWLETAMKRKDTPLFIHRIPLDNTLGIDAVTVMRNMEYILDCDHHYSLHSTLHPIWDRFIPAQNCNDSVQRAVWGEANPLVGDMSTQEAVTKIVAPFMKDEAEYQEKAQGLGLFDYIKPFTAVVDWYKAHFTG